MVARLMFRRVFVFILKRQPQVGELNFVFFKLIRFIEQPAISFHQVIVTPGTVIRLVEVHVVRDLTYDAVEVAINNVMCG